MYLVLITQNCDGTYDCSSGEYEMCRCDQPDLYVRVVSVPVCNFAQLFCQNDALDILTPTLPTLYNEVMKSRVELIWDNVYLLPAYIAVCVCVFYFTLCLITGHLI